MIPRLIAVALVGLTFGTVSLDAQTKKTTKEPAGSVEIYKNKDGEYRYRIKNAEGKPETWEIEAGAPNALFRRGFNKDSLPIGTEIVVSGYPAKNGKQRANGRDLTFPDGRKLFMASSSPDAPDKDNK